MEILSRTSFDNDDLADCRMAQIFRLEGLEALEPMGMVTAVDGGAAYVAKDENGRPSGVPALSRRSALVSSSAKMFVRGVDKAGMFPPPIRVITRYENVSHARIFGTHLFGVDFTNARRSLPGFLGRGNESTVGVYSEGCQFFRDYQREFLLMPTGLPASVTGIFVYSPSHGHCIALTSEEYAGSLRQGQNFSDGVVEISTKLARRRSRCREFCSSEMDDRECCEQLVQAFKNPLLLQADLSLLLDKSPGERFSIVTGDAVIMHKVEFVKRSGDPDLATLKGQIEDAESKKRREDAAAAERNSDPHRVKDRKGRMGLTGGEIESRNEAFLAVVNAYLAADEAVDGSLLGDLINKRKRLRAIVTGNEFAAFLEAKAELI